jgi:hypothetical protein
MGKNVNIRWSEMRLSSVKQRYASELYIFARLDPGFGEMANFSQWFQLRVNRADKTNRKRLELASKSSSISAILASLFGLNFSLQTYMELTEIYRNFFRSNKYTGENMSGETVWRKLLEKNVVT